MFQNRLMFGLITGSVSFGLSLLILRDFQRAAFTGLMGFVGSQAAVFAMAGQPDSRLHARQEALRQNIRSLQRKRSEAYESLIQLRQEQALQLTGSPAPQSPPPPASAPRSPGNPWQPRAAITPPATPKSNPVSWNLAAPKAPPIELELNGLETRVKTLSKEEESLQASLHQTLSAKQKADLHLTTSKAELNQLQAKIAEQERQKQVLAQSVSQMEQQRQQLNQDLDALQTQVTTLEKSRQELKTFLKTAPQRQQIDHGAQSLQTAIAQMQSQISSLRGELGELEGQIIQRRTEKQQLDQTLATLQAQSQQQAQAQSQQQAQAQSQQYAPTSPPQNGKTAPHPKTAATDPANKSQPIQAFAPKPPKPPIANSPSTQSGLPQEWLGLRQSLQAHEFQALRAIAMEANPVPALKRLAADHLTMPEMLIDTINERALETIGDLILETGTDAASTIIAQEYRDQVATLIAKHS
jgi:TerB-C domain